MFHLQRWNEAVHSFVMLHSGRFILQTLLHLISRMAHMLTTLFLLAFFNPFILCSGRRHFTLPRAGMVETVSLSTRRDKGRKWRGIKTSDSEPFR